MGITITILIFLVLAAAFYVTYRLVIGMLSGLFGWKD